MSHALTYSPHPTLQSHIEADATEEYGHILSSELEAGQLDAQRLRERLERLMETKKGLLAQCQQRVEEVKDKVGWRCRPTVRHVLSCPV